MFRNQSLDRLSIPLRDNSELVSDAFRNAFEDSLCDLIHRVVSLRHRVAKLQRCQLHFQFFWNQLEDLASAIV